MWNFAKEKALEKFKNPYSKEFRRVKFAYSPSALVVYVSKEEDIPTARLKLYQKYGKLENGNWNNVVDGSKMRFVPIINGRIGNEAIYNTLLKAMHTQIISKAGEITYDLPMMDLFSPKEYLKGYTMEQILHTVNRSNQENLPIFKHIVRKWTSNPDEEKYEIVCQPKMEEAAQNFLTNIQSNLKETFGLQIYNHFQAPMNTIVFNRDKTNQEVDTVLESLMIADQNDNYGNFLIEGMEVMNNAKQVKQPMNYKEESNTKEYPSDDDLSMASTTSNSSRGSKTIQFSTSAEEGNELTKERCKEEMRRHVIKYKIGLKEAKEWIKEYHSDKETLVNANTFEEIHDNITLQQWKLLRDGIHLTRKLNVVMTKVSNISHRPKQDNNFLPQQIKRMETQSQKQQPAIDVSSITVDSQTANHSTITQNSQVSRLTIDEPHQRNEKKRGGGGWR